MKFHHVTDDVNLDNYQEDNINIFVVMTEAVVIVVVDRERTLLSIVVFVACFLVLY